MRKCSKTHYIRVEFLEQVVLYEINRLACFANEYEDEFVRAMMGHSAKVTENDQARKQRKLDGLLARDKELDVLFEKIYEDVCCKGWFHHRIQYMTGGSFVAKWHRLEGR